MSNEAFNFTTCGFLQPGFCNGWIINTTQCTSGITRQWPKDCSQGRSSRTGVYFTALVSSGR